MNAFENALKQLETAANIMGLNKEIHEFLKIPMQELHVSIPVKMDNGLTKTFQGFRVRYNNALGPCKGGVRYHPEETIDTVRALSAWMTWKCSLLGLPLGGGKGGIICDTKSLSAGELERLTRGYIRKIYTNIGSGLDSLAPDVYTTPQIMAWMMDEYLTLTNGNDRGFTTGKPIELGGSQGRGDATARGGMYCLREALDLNIFTESKHQFTVAIQGYGNAGQHAHRLIEEMFPHAKVVAISDSKGGIVFENEHIDYISLKHAKDEKGSVVETIYQKITNEELLELDVDVFIPAAMESVITSENANRIKAKIILELANGPVTPEADEVLFENGVHVIPDFLANAGGVVVSYAECVQNSTNYFWTEEKIYGDLDERMSKTYHDVFNLSKKKDTDMRLAAYIIAVERVAVAMKLRGWF